MGTFCGQQQPRYFIWRRIHQLRCCCQMGENIIQYCFKNCLNIIISISGVIIIIITRAHQRRHTLMRSFCCKPLPLAERDATVSPVLSAFLWNLMELVQPSFTRVSTKLIFPKTRLIVHLRRRVKRREWETSAQLATENCWSTFHAFG